MTPQERARLLRPQAIPLWIGIIPLLMFLIYGLRSGTGLHPALIGLAAMGAGGFLTSLGYHFFCRRSIPRVVIKPMTFWRGFAIVVPILIFTLLNLRGSSSGQSLILSPNLMANPIRWLRLAAQLVSGTILPPQLLPNGSEFLQQAMFLNGSLWGALGYSVVFGCAAFGFAALRQEAFDPRQEPFGGSSTWPFLRVLIAYYYGMSLGFWFGAVGIWLGKATLEMASDQSGVQALITAFGISSNPNLAFTNALSMGGWLVTFSTLFMGRADFTVGFTDPRPEEKEPDMKIKIPELPKTPEPEFDFASIGHETEQIAQQFQVQLSDLARQFGFLDPIEPASSLVVAAAKASLEEDEKVEPPVANVISARRPDFDVSFDSAMGQLSNVYVQVSAELGSMELPLTDWLTMAEGSILELPRSKDNMMTLCINGKAIGHGRAVSLEDHKAIKVLKLSADATKNLGR